MKVRVLSALLWFAFLLLPVLATPSRAQAEDWLPISQEDLAMKDNPKHKGDHAMILWREVVGDDEAGRETNYVRIKIFDDIGKSYADVEIEPFNVPGFEISNIQGRTIHPGGAIVPFDGKVFDKQIVKYHFLRLTAKTFTLPDVTPGSIIEYKYTRSWDNSWLYGTFWWVQDGLFQRKAHFSLHPSIYLPIRWSAKGVTADHAPVSQKKGDKITMDIEDMPGYEEEAYMPPEAEVRARIDFFYYDKEFAATVDDFWKASGRRWGIEADGFMDKKGAVKRELASLVSPSDSNDVKLHKIYDRVQSLRNLSYEPDKTDKELKREKQKDARNMDDVLNNGYGWHNDLNRTFAALARGAGFDVTLVQVADRSEAFFDKNLLTMRQFSSEVVLVRDGGKELYFDPGTAFCPFGMLPWEDTATISMRLEKNSTLVKMPPPASDNAGITRKADLALQNDGSVKGSIEITFSGLEAMNYRQKERDQDDAARKKYLEDLVRGWISASATVELQKVNDWKSSKVPLIVTYQVTIPGYAEAAGRRIMLPLAVFSGAYRNPFASKSRANTVIFPYPWVNADDVTISLAPEFQLDSLPKQKLLKNGLAEFSADYASERNVVHAARRFRMNGFVVDTKYYPALRAYFGQIEATDDEQALLKPAAN
jgi:hypothetical protein